MDEVQSLKRRFPKRGIDPTIPEKVRSRMVEMQKDRELRRMGEAYDRAMPSPEPGEAVPRMRKGGKGYAKGGVTRGDGCITKGHTKGKVM